MTQDDNFVNPSYNEGTPDSAGNIAYTYIVEETDTLPDIARKFGISVEELLEANKDNIADASAMIQTGTRLMVPNRGGITGK